MSRPPGHRITGSWISRAGGQFARNVGWNILGNIGGKVAGPVFHILIARLLLPGDFGVFAVAVAWLAVFDIAKDWGLAQAIVVRRGGEAEIALQFTVQLLSAFLFCAVTLAMMPVAASFFGLPDLGKVLLLVSVASFISAVADPIITERLMTQRYRQLAIRQMVTPVASGIVGLVLAYWGYGVYSLVTGLLAGQTAGALSLLAGGRAGLKLSTDLALMRKLMSIGKHIALQRLFGFLAGQADSFIVGKALGSQALGLYRMGNVLAFLIPAASVPQAQQVVFTELSANSRPENIRKLHNLFTVVAGGLLLLCSVALYIAAPLLVPAMLGEQWRDSVPLMQIFSVVIVTGFITPLNADLAKILGFIQIYTHFAAGRSLATVVCLLWAAQYSVVHVAMTWVVVGFISNLVNDVIFYAKQSAVRLTYGKVALTGASWLWAAFVIIGTIGRLT